MNIGVIGVGKIGSCMMAAFIIKGHNVLGYDINKDPLSTTSKTESRLKEIIYKYNLKSHILPLKEVVKNSDIIFIIVSTPSLPNGRFDIKYVEKVLTECLEINPYKIYVINSTVPPGTCRRLSKYARSLTLYYNPMLIRLGSVIQDILENRIILIGSQNKSPGILEKFWKTVSNGRIFCSDYETIEVTKLMINSIMTVNISLINKIGEIYDKYKVDFNILKDIFPYHRLFSLKSFTPGLGYGGPCLPRDNKMMQEFCKRIRVNANLFREIDNINYEQIDRAIKICLPYQRIGIYGIGYKLGSDIIEDSQGYILYLKLKELGKKIEIYDPYNKELTTVTSESELEAKTDIVILTLPYKARIKKFISLWRK